MLIPILKQKPALSTSFVHAQSYNHQMSFISWLYVCDKELYIIKGIEEGNVEQLTDYFEEFLSKLNEKNVIRIYRFFWVYGDERHFSNCRGTEYYQGILVVNT